MATNDDRMAAYQSDQQHVPVPHADIQIGDYVEITPRVGAAVTGHVTGYERLGNMYTVRTLGGPRRVTGSRLRK